MMKFSAALAAASFAVFGAMSTTAHAANCEGAEGDVFDLTNEEVTILYDCVKDKMAEQYASQGDAVAQEYRNWTNSQTIPAVQGAHQNRFLQTYANDIAAEQYLKFEEEGFTMPVGAVLAKESFALRKGKLRVGPLFIMTKLAAGEAPDAGDWRYDALQPNGKVMKISQKFCADCHLGWDYRDSLAYPVEEARVGYTN